MKNVLIIGGGLSGLSAAVNLLNKKLNVILLEASPKLGGRAYSFIEPKTKVSVDNGQHIMMSCYHHTMDYLSKINALDKLSIQERLKVNFVGRGNTNFNLVIPKRLYPLNLLFGFLNFNALSFKERLKVIDFFLDLICCFEEDLRNYSVYDWLKKKKQSDHTIKSLWEILCVGIMNTSVHKASAELFAYVLKEIFLNGSKNFQIVLPKVSLSELFVEPAYQLLKETSAIVKCNEKVIGIQLSENGYNVKTSSAKYENIDFIISAVPFFALDRILQNSNIPIKQFIRLEYSPILSVHIWLNENIFDKEFYGLIDSDIHWVFNHGSYISIVVSSATNLISLPKAEIIEKIVCELEKFFSMFSRKQILNFQIIKEKRATFIPNVDSVKQREMMKFEMDNFYVAGDWTNTGLPGTIEGAIKSGKICADAVKALH